MEDLIALPLSDLLRRMRSKEISPVELMRQTLDKAHAVNGDLSAFITIADETAMEEAGKIETAYLRGDEMPLLAGIPISVKDTEPTQGMVTTYGSAIFKDNVPAEDGTAAANLRRSGAVIFAKSNTPAFGHKDTTENLLVPPARNPLNPDHTAGGSSGGAGIAVATGISAVAHGTDGAGSVRIPASLCGVHGFKPTYGRIPNWPNSDLWAARTHHGLLGRSVEDIAVTMEALAGGSELDPLSSGERLCWTSRQDAKALGSKTGLFVPAFGADEIDPEVADCCARTVRALAGHGLAIEERDIDLPPTHDWYWKLWQPSLAALLKPWRHASPELIEQSLRQAADEGASITLDEYLSARESRSRFHTDFLRLMGSFDYLICPTLPCASWSVDGEPLLPGGRGPRHGSSGSRWEHLYIFNALGWPAISVPCGHTKDGRPIGIQVVTRRNEDLLCLQIASLLEKI